MPRKKNYNTVKPNKVSKAVRMQIIEDARLQLAKESYEVKYGRAETAIFNQAVEVLQRAMLFIR